MNITKIQELLNQKGFGPLIEDGIFGPKTQNAVKSFQRQNKLKEDGMIGPATMAFLDSSATPKPTMWELQPIHAQSLNLRLRAMEIAISQNGIREITGKNDGPAVETFLSSVGLPKGYAWCMAFVYWCYNQASIQLGIMNPLIRTAGCMNQWNEIKPSFKVAQPQKGDIFIMNLGSGAGHTGIITEVHADGSFDTIEGNTNNKGSANGDGVYVRKRNKGNKIAGYIRCL